MTERGVRVLGLDGLSDDREGSKGWCRPVEMRSAMSCGKKSGPRVGRGTIVGYRPLHQTVKRIRPLRGCEWWPP